MTARRETGLAAALALLASAAGCDLLPGGQKAAPKVAPPARVAVNHNVWTDEQFENWVLNESLSGGGARKTLATQLALVVEDADRVCRLTDAQKAKLNLAGRGDVKRLFDMLDRAKEKFRALGNDVNKLNDIMADITPVQTAIQAGLAHDGSLVVKTVRGTLTPEQRALYDAARRERLAHAHRARVELLVTNLEQVVPLQDARRQELIALLLKETKPPPRPHQYEFYFVAVQAARLPEDKLKPLFSDTQWKAVQRYFQQFRGIEQHLRQAGLFDDEPDRDKGK